MLELLMLWGDARVQQALWSSHRNFESFEIIAKGMAKQVFSCTAQESRMKTKAMRLQYKRCFTHNQRSGQQPLFCPFYSELHGILKENASMAPFHVAGSITIHRKNTTPLFPVAPGSLVKNS